MFRHTYIPLRQFPQVFPVVTSILLVQTVVFIMLLVTGHAGNPETWVQYGAYEGWRIDEGEYWRLFSSLFVHVSFLQFLFISFALYIFAPQLELLFGRTSFFILYVGTGIAGNLGLYLFDISGVHTGASACIYGLLGVYVYLYVRKLIDSQVGKGLLILTAINLFFDLNLILVHLCAFISGFVLGAILIVIKQMRLQDPDK